MRFSEDNGLPLYQQVADQIEESILTGALAEGDRAPSTTEISTTYRINPATVLKGMNLLVDKGLLEKRRGVGMFVTADARTRARGKGRTVFLREKVPALVGEARNLGITLDGLVDAVERCYEAASGQGSAEGGAAGSPDSSASSDSPEPEPAFAAARGV